MYKCYIINLYTHFYVRWIIIRKNIVMGMALNVHDSPWLENAGAHSPRPACMARASWA